MLPAPVWQIIRGFCMGAADIVPGVSGGTIALVFGIYQKLVDSVHTGAQALGALLKGDGSGFVAKLKAVDWFFLAPLLLGIGIAFVALSGIIESLLEDHPEAMAGLFLGLVAASVVIARNEISRWTPPLYVIAAVVAAATFIGLGFQSGAVKDPSLLAFVGAGAIAICAMILPGISGSFLLLMMGMYAPLLSAVHDRELGKIAVFMVGATAGLALFSTLLNWLLEHHRETLLAALIGLMVGSVRVLWPWPNGVGIISDVEDEVVKGTDLGWATSAAEFFWPTVLALAAFGIVLAIAAIGERQTATPTTASAD